MSKNALEVYNRASKILSIRIWMLTLTLTSMFISKLSYNIFLGSLNHYFDDNIELYIDENMDVCNSKKNKAQKHP